MARKGNQQPTKADSLFFPLLSVALCIFGVMGFWMSMRALLSSPWPLDYDSFYYLSELRSYLVPGGGGGTHFLPFFFVFGKLASLLGWSERQALDFIFVSSFLVFAAALAALAFDRKRPFAVFPLLYLAFSSKILLYVHYGFLKQAAGMAAFASFLAFLRLSGGRKGRTKAALIGAAIVSGVAAAMFHKFSGLLTLAYLGLFVKDSAMGKFAKRSLLVVAASLLLILSFLRLPDIASLLTWNWPPLWYRFYEHRIISPFEYVEYLLNLLLAVLMAGALWIRKARFKPMHLMLLGYFALMAFFATPSAWRFGVSSCWLLLLALAFSQSYPEGESPFKGSEKSALLGVAVLLALLNAAFFPQEPRLLGPSMPVSSLEDNQESLKKWLPQDALVVAPHGVEFRVVYFLGRDSLQRAPRGFPPEKIFVIDRIRGRDMRCVEPAQLAGQDPRAVDCVTLDPNWRIFRAFVPKT